MRPITVNIHDAKTQLSRLVALAEKGARITIARGGKAVAELGPLGRNRRVADVAADPLLQVDAYSFDGPIDAMTNREIDRILYGA